MRLVVVELLDELLLSELEEILEGREEDCKDELEGMLEELEDDEELEVRELEEEESATTLRSSIESTNNVEVVLASMEILIFTCFTELDDGI